MSKKDSVSRTLLVAFGVCLVCAVVVSSAAVVLKPLQDINSERNRQQNILAAAGLLEQSVPLAEQFEKVQTRVVDLRTGRFTDEVDPATYDNLRAARTSGMATSFSELGAEDRVGFTNREHYALVYLIENESGLDKVILPIRGYGLWSTLHGFIALESDLNTVAGLGFYEHGETPGLGGEVDNPNWKAIWEGKRIYSEQGDLLIEVVKGSVDPGATNAQYRVDGLSGATLTARGVNNLVRFWLGEQGFKPFLDNLKAGEV